MPLTEHQIERFSRQIILPEIGGIGQQKLLAARVGLAAPERFCLWAARYLAAAGIGRIIVSGPIAGADRLVASHPDCRVVVGEAVAADVVIVDVADEAFARARRAGVPVIAVGAQALTALRRSEPSSRLLPFAGLGAACAPLSPVPLLATVAATEALKILLGAGEPLYGRVLSCDANSGAVSVRTSAVATPEGA
jgi:hypothetical protein